MPPASPIRAGSDLDQPGRGGPRRARPGPHPSLTRAGPPRRRPVKPPGRSTIPAWPAHNPSALPPSGVPVCPRTAAPSQQRRCPSRTAKVGGQTDGHAWPSAPSALQKITPHHPRPAVAPPLKALSSPPDPQHVTPNTHGNASRPAEGGYQRSSSATRCVTSTPTNDKAALRKPGRPAQSAPMQGHLAAGRPQRRRMTPTSSKPPASSARVHARQSGYAGNPLTGFTTKR